MAAYEGSCVARRKTINSKTSWWNEELSNLRKRVRRLFNRAKRQQSWEEYRRTLTAYNLAVRKAKRDSWRNFCTEVSSAAEYSRLHKVLAKAPLKVLGTIKKDEGYTESAHETFDNLITTHFPDSEAVSWIETGALPCGRGDLEAWRRGRFLVDAAHVRWAIGTFKPYKSPGDDGIYPALLQHGIETLMPKLISLFRSSIALGYIPRTWRAARLCFIPKSGRSTHLYAKDYRPICLSSFLLKTLEKIIDRHIRDTTLRQNPLSIHQYAYQTGRSCELALHRLVCSIERAMQDKEIALCAFLDVEGAFDSTPITAVQSAMEAKGVEKLLITWTVNLLKNRVLHISEGDFEKYIIPGTGCPQGGVLSPLLWSLVMDSLLARLTEQGYRVQAYADDLVITIVGKVQSTLSELLNAALSSVHSWCLDRQLNINPQKITLVPFTTKRKLEGLEIPRLDNREINYSSSVKYLGVTLDSKLSWKEHISRTASKAIRTLWACRRAVSGNWGMTPKAIHWVYNMIIKPILSYASIVWWHRCSCLSYKRILNSPQRLACLMTTGAMGTTPTGAMEILLNLRPVDILIEETARLTAYRFKMTGQGLCPRQNGHCDIFRRIEQNPLLCMPSDFQDIYSFSSNFTTAIRPREEAMDRKIAPSRTDIFCFTDGSKKESGTGAGVWFHHTSVFK